LGKQAQKILIGAWGRDRWATKSIPGWAMDPEGRKGAIFRVATAIRNWKRGKWKDLPAHSNAGFRPDEWVDVGSHGWIKIAIHELL